VKTYVYVDGFNFYFGCVKGTPYKWLNFRKLCETLLPRNQIECIKYFTAKVSARPSNPSAPVNQEIFLRALKTLSRFEIHLGHFLTHTVRMPLAHPVSGLPPFVDVIKTEEKGSDVNLATQLLNDGHLGRYEVAIVVSGDSDLLGPVKIVMEDLGKTVGVLNPQKRTCRVLANQATFYRHIRQGVLSTCLFPPTLTDANGTFHKPPTW
jgi:NYN domain-containing protein